MKFTPHNGFVQLNEELQKELLSLRKRRNFNIDEYLKYKSFIIADYLKKFKIDTCVVALSGGIDSSVVLGLLFHTQKEYGVPANIIPVTLPSSARGVTNQKESVEKSTILCQHFKTKFYTINIGESVNNISTQLEIHLNKTSTNWAKGQLSPYIRTPYLYYICTLLNDNGNKSLIVGTINKDEGAYLGYIGKASDAMVDLQIISDIHKSEVRSIAKHFNLPKEIIDQIPNGDMHDNRSDEEVFGASYDFVELFLLEKEYRTEFNKKITVDSLSIWNAGCDNIENLHSFNKHKYIGHSPAVHLDILGYSIKNGWKNNCTTKENDEPINFNAIINLQNIKTDFILNSIDNLFEQHDLNNLLQQLNQSSWVRAGNDGYTTTKTDKGSSRLSFFSTTLSKEILKVLKESRFIMENNELFELQGVSNLFRVIKYEEGDYLLPHYDHSYNYNSSKKTLKSVIIVLQEAIDGGELVFVKDSASGCLEEKDWDRPSQEEERISSIKVKENSIITFKHNLLHESLKIKQGTKIIIRTDLVYEKKNNY